ncbi:MAG: flagellar hook capping protein [Lachnospiraceae bacterium]|nr:flagellar hook capping protein [Lachnospiraceae bacterium]
MAIAPIKNGKPVETTSQVSIKESEKKKNNSTVDKDQFLQLLVAQMKYQDPLEPTSNTEYISQYATFSELEQMQNMSASLELARASSLVGQTVLMKVTDSSGRQTTVQGNVDYVYYENNKAFLSINGELYSMDDLDTVADPKYLSAYTKAAEFLNAYNKLPILQLVTLENEDAIKKLDETYQNMSDYEKKFISDDYVKGLKKYVEKIEELKAGQKEEDGDKTEGTDTDKDEETEETDKTEGADKENGEGSNTDKK